MSYAEPLVNKYISRLKNTAENAIKKNDYELALQSVYACASILYSYNQKYTDNDLEECIERIGKNVVHLDDDWKTDDNTILFYDGFGLDRRGIAIVACKAIVMNGYHLVYASPLITKEKQPSLKKALEGYDVDWEYFDDSGAFISEISDIKTIAEHYKPKFAFLYTTPFDVAGVAVFNELRGKTFRCQLDLTDHAFWLGLNAFDLCNGGRKFSASIEHFERGISIDKMLMLDANLFIDDCQFQGLPFDENHRFIFSGGQLYKTLGDENDTFYEIVDRILVFHPDIYFLYAGSGDSSKMVRLMDKYAGRAFLIQERPDFYQIIKRCTLYLNTYPMFGGLMMRYAALAGKIPVTLKHNNDSDGILIDQEKRKIEYNSYDELVEDVDRLLNDEPYLKVREKLLEGSVVTENCYVRNIRLIIEEHKTEFSYGDIQKVDTSEFRKEFAERFGYLDIVRSIVQKRNSKLISYFPKEFAYKFYIRLMKTGKGDML